MKIVMKNKVGVSIGVPHPLIQAYVNVRQHMCVCVLGGGALQSDVHIHGALHVFDEYS